MSSNDRTETITAFSYGDVTYELDHLGECWPQQTGTFAVYRDGDQLVEFDSAHELPTAGEPLPEPLIEMLIEEAIAALGDLETGDPSDV